MRPLTIVILTFAVACTPPGPHGSAEARRDMYVASLEWILEEAPASPERVLVHPYLQRTNEEGIPAPSGRPRDWLQNDSAAIRRATERVPAAALCDLVETPELIWCGEEGRFDAAVLTEPRIAGDSASVSITHVEDFGRQSRAMVYRLVLEKTDGVWRVASSRVIGSIN